MSCYDFHENCPLQIFHKAISTFKYVLRVYAIAHGIPTILFRWKKLTNEPKKTILELLIKMAKSMGFLGGFILGCRVVACCYCNLTGNKFNRLTVFIMGVLCGLPCITENTSRIAEYSVFTFPRVIEGIFDLLFKLEWLKPIPYADKIIFALSMAAILVINDYKKDYLTANYTKFINYIFELNNNNEKETNEKKEKEEKEGKELAENYC